MVPIPAHNPSSQHEETMIILGEIRDALQDINSKVGECPPALTDTLEDLSQGVDRLKELGEAHSRESGVLIYQRISTLPVLGVAAHPVDESWKRRRGGDLIFN